MSDSLKPGQPPPPEIALPIVLVMDGAGLIVEWTPNAEKIFGWPREEAVGQKLSARIIPERHRAAHEAGLKRFLAGGAGALLDRTLQIVAIDREGREFNLEIRISAEQCGDGYQFVACARRVD